MNCIRRLYFDHAATSYPKPPTVFDAIGRALTLAAGNPGRSAHALAVCAAEEIYATRETLARFFDASSAEGVVFTLNATHALNVAIASACHGGGHVLCSDIEHNAVLRPLAALARAGRIRYEVFPSEGNVREHVKERLRADTVLVVLNHASNVFGRVTPIREVGALCKERGIYFVVDASQSAGHIPISVRRMGINALCLPAHKGLYGILGAGAVIFEGDTLPHPLLYGGSGAFSRLPDMPEMLPERLEAGSLPVPAVLALGAGVRFVEEKGVEAVADHVAALEALLHEHLAEIKGIRVHRAHERGSGSVSFTHESLSPALLAERLDEAGVAVRSGLHCAPLAHEVIGTAREGTVRASVGLQSTKEECFALFERLSEIVKTV